jgi:hypothetical protein
LNSSQFGFRADHSTTLQCMRLAEHVTLNFNNNMAKALVFLNIEKAFDTTWHSALVYILSELEFSTNLIKLIASFLTDRTFGRRRIFCAKKYSGRDSSSFCPCPSIVQSIYKLCPATCGTYLALFADGTCIYATET